MLSIVTAVHNALPMNRLYWAALSANTELPFELIVVDNHSTDGTERFFRELADRSSAEKQVVYLRNERNLLYPVAQNQGMRAARYDILCFLNNDIWMPRGWEKPFVAALAENPLLVLGPTGAEAQPRQSLSDALKRRWKRMMALSRLWAAAFGRSEEARLWKALRWMYGDLENFRSPTPADSPAWFNGIKGDVVIFHRELLARVPGIWDERVQAADWHLYLTLARLHEQDSTIPLPRILRDVYIHHFGRYSARLKYESIPELAGTLSVEALWGRDTVRRLWWGYSLPQ